MPEPEIKNTSNWNPKQEMITPCRVLSEFCGGETTAGGGQQGTSSWVLLEWIKSTIFEEGPWRMGRISVSGDGVEGKPAERRVEAEKSMALPGGSAQSLFSFLVRWLVGSHRRWDDRMENWLYSLGSSAFLNPEEEYWKLSFTDIKKFKFLQIMRYYILFIRVTVFLKKLNTKCCWECGEVDTLINSG